MKFEELPTLIKCKIIDKVMVGMWKDYWEDFKIKFLKGTLGVIFLELGESLQQHFLNLAEETFNKKIDSYRDLAVRILICNDFRIESNSGKEVFPINFNVEKISKEVMGVFTI